MKLVATPIPSYPVSTLLFPKGWCEEVEKFIKNFWWGHSSISPQHYTPKSYGSICQPRDFSGLGIWRLCDVNWALITKVRVVDMYSAKWILGPDDEGYLFLGTQKIKVVLGPGGVCWLYRISWAKACVICRNRPAPSVFSLIPGSHLSLIFFQFYLQRPSLWWGFYPSFFCFYRSG